VPANDTGATNRARHGPVRASRREGASGPPGKRAARGERRCDL